MPLVVTIAALVVTLQLSAPHARLIAALRPALPYPVANADGDLPVDHDAGAKWFVVWPTAGDPVRVVVRANPLHPEVQRASAAAMAEINAAVAAAERRAQKSYEQALERLRTTGTAGTLDAVSLDDEGVAGDRIDAELEVTIALVPPVSGELTSATPPLVEAGPAGAWLVTIPAHTYRVQIGDESHERFRAAETRIYFGLPSRPEVVDAGDALVGLRVSPAASSVAVAITGNAELSAAIVRSADWGALHRP